MINRPSKDSIWSHYDRLREKNREILSLRKKELYEKSPRLQEIEKIMAQNSLLTNRSLLLNKKDPQEILDSLKNSHTLLKKERSNILTSFGLPTNYLDPIYSCTLCEDTGYVVTKPCICLKRFETKLRYKGSNLENVLAEENFDTFRLDYYNEESHGNEPSAREQMQEYFWRAMDYASKFEAHNTNLLFFGKPGLGKTFLCHSIAKDLMDNGHSVLYITASELMDFVRNSKFGFESGEAAPEELAILYTSDLLIIDDLGTEISSQFNNLVLYELLNRRITDKKKMVISTNLEIDDLTSLYSERISSRLFGNFEFFAFIGEDIRLKKVSLL